ncbi:membrane protein, partial [Mycobacterium avium 11-0986]
AMRGAAAAHERSTPPLPTPRNPADLRLAVFGSVARRSGSGGRAASVATCQPSERKIMSATTIDRTTGRDGLLRLAMRADAAISGLVGLAGIPLVGWLAEVSGTTTAFEYGMSAFLIGYGVLVFGLAALPSVRRAGMAVIIGNLLYTAAAVVLVLADVFPLTSTGVVLNLAAGVYTLVFAELQYQGWRRARA